MYLAALLHYKFLKDWNQQMWEAKLSPCVVPQFGSGTVPEGLCINSFVQGAIGKWWDLEKWGLMGTLRIVGSVVLKGILWPLPLASSWKAVTCLCSLHDAPLPPFLSRGFKTVCPAVEDWNHQNSELKYCFFPLVQGSSPVFAVVTHHWLTQQAWGHPYLRCEVRGEHLDASG